MSTVYLRRPPDWEEHEKPALPGSPAMPVHTPGLRVAYALVAVLVALSGGWATRCSAPTCRPSRARWA